MPPDNVKSDEEYRQVKEVVVRTRKLADKNVLEFFYRIGWQRSMIREYPCMRPAKP